MIGVLRRRRPPAGRGIGLLRRRSPTGPDAVAEALRSVRDGLRSRLSLREALLRASAAEGSPLGSLAGELASGRPLAASLRHVAEREAGSELACPLLVLSVQAETGGDPVPLLERVEDRLRRRASAAREARSLTTQARMSARAILLLTPGFLALLMVVDPSGTWSALTGPGGATALGLGLTLLAAGAVWIAKIIRTATGAGGASSRVRQVPVLRAAAVVFTGKREHGAGEAETSDAAEALALVLDAGVGPSLALELVAPAMPGRVGDALREAVARVRAGASVPDAVLACLPPAGRAPDRFAETFASCVRLGLPLADPMRSLAHDLRDAETTRLAESVRRASVRVLLPLALLILPAFVLACLVPLLLSGLGGIVL